MSDRMMDMNVEYTMLDEIENHTISHMFLCLKKTRSKRNPDKKKNNMALKME